MRKIAIIFNGDLRNRKGYLNAVIERAKGLCACEEFSVDIFCLSQYDNWLIRTLRHTQKSERTVVVKVDGLTINMIWYPFSLMDYILSVRLHLGRVVEPFILKRLVVQFKNYDLVSAHSMIAGMLAYNIYERYNIPYCITWHGSDIHTEPFVNKISFKIVADLISKATRNIFVSEALSQTAREIVPNVDGDVLYNAASDKFYRFEDKARNELCEKHKSTTNKVVAFAGGLVSIKNAEILPDIFNSIQQHFKEKIEFWIIGDGKLRDVIDDKLSQMPDVYCKLWGNQPVEEMPLLLNCVDVLILPSKNEGLPLIVVEAIKSGVNVVASDVGGIKEAIGVDNVVALGDDFVQRFSKRVVDILEGGCSLPKIPDEFNWQRTSDKEMKICNNIINKNKKL